MPNQPWLDSVRERLAQHGLPPTYIQRCVAELADHLHDLKEEATDTEAVLCSRLGEAEQVARAEIVAYRRRHFLGRHPLAAFLVFAISPVIAWYFLYSASSMFLQVCFHHDWTESRWVLGLALVACSTVGVILYGELALWLGIGRKWTLVSCPALGSIASLFSFEFGPHAFVSLVQFAAPFVVGWWIVTRRCNSSVRYDEVHGVRRIAGRIVYPSCFICSLDHVWWQPVACRHSSDYPFRCGGSRWVHAPRPNRRGWAPPLQDSEKVPPGPKMDIMDSIFVIALATIQRCPSPPSAHRRCPVFRPSDRGELPSLQARQAV